MKILVWENDDYLYYDLVDFLYDIKVVQGATALNSTLSRHKVVRNYLKDKQKHMLSNIEKLYFNSDGSINLERLESLASRLSHNNSCSLQK